MLTELGRLQTTIQVGNLQTNRCPRFVIRSSRFVSTTKALVRLWDVNFHLLKSVKKGDLALITIGYSGQKSHTWRFEVETIHEIKKNTLDLELVKEDVRFKRKKIKKTWENETPAPIVKNIIQETGFQPGAIENIQVVFPKFIANSKSAWDTIKGVERSMRLSHRESRKYLALWQDKKGVFHWSAAFEPSDPLRVFSIGEGLITHRINNRSSDITKGENADLPLNSFETFLTPDLKHSQTIRVVDKRRQVDGEFPIIDVIHRFINNSASTCINYLPVTDYERADNS